MKNIWKWILGVVLVLLVVTVLLAIPFAMRSYVLANNLPQTRDFYNGPMMRGVDGFGWMHPQMHGGQYGFGGERGFFPRIGFGGRLGIFGFGFMFLGLAFRLIPLLLLGLLFFGIYQLGKRSGRRSAMSPAEPAPVKIEPPQKDAAASGSENTPES
jgi:Na+-transporting methylmalonyl-CoA/oxaloacetate decarboxylase gamma subunit